MKSMLSSREKFNAESIGVSGMLWQTQEECGELVKAIGKYNRTRGLGQKTEVSKEDAYYNLIEEITDVEICIDQLKFLLNLDNSVVRDCKVNKVYNRYRKG